MCLTLGTMLPTPHANLPSLKDEDQTLILQVRKVAQRCRGLPKHTSQCVTTVQDRSPGPSGSLNLDFEAFLQS